MLKVAPIRKNKTGKGRFAIVASQYNSRYVDSMVRGARSCLAHGGGREVEVVRVPGAFEIPLAVAILARRRWPRLTAIIALGVILRGETRHADHIGQAVTDGLLRIQLETEIPVIHEVLLLETVEQARKRCLDPRFNRGREAAQTALAAGAILSRLGGKPRVGRRGRGSE